MVINGCGSAILVTLYDIVGIQITKSKLSPGEGSFDFTAESAMINSLSLKQKEIHDSKFK